VILPRLNARPRLSSLKCELTEQQRSEPSVSTARSTPGSSTISLEEYLDTARRLTLGREGDWSVQLLQQKVATVGVGAAAGKGDVSYAVGVLASRGEEETAGRGGGIYGWMNAKKKEEVMGMQELVSGMVTSHSTTCVADIGSGNFPLALSVSRYLFVHICVCVYMCVCIYHDDV